MLQLESDGRVLLLALFVQLVEAALQGDAWIRPAGEDLLRGGGRGGGDQVVAVGGGDRGGGGDRWDEVGLGVAVSH